MALAYPVPAEYLYGLLRHCTVADLERRFAQWGFTARESHSLLSLRPLANRHGLAQFAEQVSDSVRQSPEDYPPVLRPRAPSIDLDARRSRYRALLKGKRVALVGPSQSIVGSRQGKTLEGYDLIARINFQWPIPPRLTVDLGQRMDILYHCCNGDVPMARLFQPGFERARFVCWQFGIDSHRLHQYCLTLAIPELEISSVFEQLLERMNAFPTTGTAALFDLLSSDLERLYVTGMTFFRDPHYEGYLTGGDQAGREYRRGQSERVGIHDVSAQLRLVRSIHASDPRLVVDPVLREILAAPAG